MGGSLVRALGAGVQTLPAHRSGVRRREVSPCAPTRCRGVPEPGRAGPHVGMPARRSATASIAVAALALAGRAAPSPSASPLIGVNLSNLGGRGCAIDGQGIVATYDRAGVRARV